MLEIALALIPLFLLLAALVAGYYPGHEAIVRLSSRIASRPRRRGTKRQVRPRAPRVDVAAGGLLIALGLAKRPPPLAA